MLTGPRVPSDARVTALDGEGPEAAQFHTITARQRIGDFVQNRIHDVFDVALIKMRITFRNSLDKFRFYHGASAPEVVDR